MTAIPVQLNTVYIALLIIFTIINTGIQIGVYSMFRKDTEAKLKEHDKAIANLNTARETQGNVLTEINTTIKFIDKNVTAMSDKIDSVIENGSK
jgi:hypothetical protein